MAATKVSELISLLQAFLKDHGDLPTTGMTRYESIGHKAHARVRYETIIKDTGATVLIDDAPTIPLMLAHDETERKVCDIDFDE